MFLWTLAAPAAAEPLTRLISVHGGAQRRALLLAAALAGLTAESGPRTIFVTVRACGTIPFGVLLANSIAQDGCGMLLLPARSRRAFLLVKGINWLTGLVAGAAALLLS